MPALNWSFEPSIILGIGLWMAAYALAVNPMRRSQHWGTPVPLPRQLAFHLGTICAFIALVSPLDALADTWLFSAHMVQHMLLTFVAPPLWLIGTPDWLVRRLIPVHWVNVITQPMIAFVIFNGVMWVWHIPTAYDAALRLPLLHIVEHLSFMAAAVIGWWPILGPDLAGRMNAPLKLAYLLPSLLSCGALAALITLSTTQLYPFYGSASLKWGLVPLTDQALGGLAMWLPGDMIYMVLIVYTVSRWLDQTDTEWQGVKL